MGGNAGGASNSRASWFFVQLLPGTPGSIEEAAAGRSRTRSSRASRRCRAWRRWSSMPARRTRCASPSTRRRRPAWACRFPTSPRGRRRRRLRRPGPGRPPAVPAALHRALRSRSAGALGAVLETLSWNRAPWATSPASRCGRRGASCTPTRTAIRRSACRWTRSAARTCWRTLTAVKKVVAELRDGPLKARGLSASGTVFGGAQPSTACAPARRKPDRRRAAVAVVRVVVHARRATVLIAAVIPVALLATPTCCT